MELKKPTDESVNETATSQEQAAAAAAAQVTVRQRVYLLWQELGMVAILVLLCIFMALFAPYFLTFSNLVNVAQQSSINAILAAGMTFVILTGGIDLSVGSGLAVAGVAAVWLAYRGVPGIIDVLAGLVIGCLCGWLNGVLIAKFKLLPFIVTLGALTYLRGVAYLFTGAYPIVVPNLSFGFLGNGFVGPLPWPVVIALLVYIVGYIVLNRTTFGRRVYAIGGNEQAARLTGINVDRILLLIYTISGLCMGIAGVIYAARLLSAQPTGGQSYELYAIAAVILGGTSFTGGVGSIVGTLIGALIIGVLNNGLVLMNVPFFYQLIIQGAVIIIAVLLDQLRTRAAAR